MDIDTSWLQKMILKRIWKVKTLTKSSPVHVAARQWTPTKTPHSCVMNDNPPANILDGHPIPISPLNKITRTPQQAHRPSFPLLHSPVIVMTRKKKISLRSLHQESIVPVHFINAFDDVLLFHGESFSTL